jgi:N-acetylglucosamine malate deacetylase 1
LGYVEQFARLVHSGRAMATPSGPPTEPRRPQAGANTCLIMSPHPDDECIIGGLAWRLQQEAGWRVVNLAITHGSNPLRQLARARELHAACAHLGFECQLLGERGLLHVRPHTQLEQAALWQAHVAQVVAQLHRLQPQLILCPHPEDAQSAHSGTWQLTLDALAQMPSDFTTQLAYTEYWSTMTAPNLMLQLSRSDLAQLMSALMQHVGEVSRNPYHLSLAAWAMDNVRRGAELVGSAGAAAPDFEFAALYQVQTWQQGKLHSSWERGRFADIASAPKLT